MKTNILKHLVALLIFVGLAYYESIVAALLYAIWFELKEQAK